MAYKLGPTHKKGKREMPALLESRSAKESSPNKFQGSGFFLTCVNLVCIFQWPRLRSSRGFNGFFVNCFCYNCVNNTILKYDWFFTAHILKLNFTIVTLKLSNLTCPITRSL